MKINFEVDLTPAELRQCLGLPDLTPFHDEMLNAVKSQMEESVRNYDPSNLIRQWFEGGMTATQELQKTFASVMSNAAASKES